VIALIFGVLLASYWQDAVWICLSLSHAGRFAILSDCGYDSDLDINELVFIQIREVSKANPVDGLKIE